MELQGDQMVRRFLIGADVLGTVDFFVRVLVAVVAPPLDHAAPLRPMRSSERMIPSRGSIAVTTQAPTAPPGGRLVAGRVQVAAGGQRVELGRLDNLRER